MSAARCPQCETIWTSAHSAHPRTVCPVCQSPLIDQPSTAGQLHAPSDDRVWQNGQQRKGLCGTWIERDQVASSYDRITCPDCLATLALQGEV